MADPEASRVDSPTSLAELDDEALVRESVAGRREAFDVIVERHRRSIYQVCYRFVNNHEDASDLAQEVFVRAWRALPRFKGDAALSTWLYRIAVNLSLNTIRARKATRDSTPSDDPRIEALLTETRPSQGSDPAAQTHQRQLAVALCEGIDKLSDTLRTTLILVCIDGVGHDEASKILGCPEGTVAWRVHEARRKLREYLAERGFGGEAG